MKIINSKESIKIHADRVFELRSVLNDILTDEENTSITGLIKDKVQDEAFDALALKNFRGAVVAATGAGKSKVGIKLASSNYHQGKTKGLIVVPTEKLRDEGWREEFHKWNEVDTWESVNRCCYASLTKFINEEFDYVILDEGHNITENNSEFFKNNIVHQCVLLTATKPKNETKKQILTSLNILPAYEITLDESVKLGLVAPYDITVITFPLDNTDKYIPAGNEKKRFFTTEKANYDYLSRLTLTAPSKSNFLRRMRLVYNLKSKTRTANLILEHVIPKELRTLIFCGSKEQAIELCDRTYFSKPVLAKADKDKPSKVERISKLLSRYEGDTALNDFQTGVINRLASVEALNEGHNIHNVDVACLVQVNSDWKDLVQRIGRALRYRPGHIAKIIILCIESGVDRDWVVSCLKGLDSDKIKWVTLADLRAGTEKIIF